jgi:hypothetical protein
MPREKKMTSQIGRVSELWRYPVQSLQGEQLAALDFTSAGVVGDRGYCVVDDTGEGGTAARPQWKKLIGWRARYLAEPKAGADLPKVEIIFDDGTAMISDDARLNGAISERLGRRAPSGSDPGARCETAVRRLALPSADQRHAQGIERDLCERPLRPAALPPQRRARLRRSGRLY